MPAMPRRRRVGEQLARPREVVLALLVAAEQLDQRAHLGMLAAQLAEALHVGGDARVGEGRVELGQAQGEAVELLAEGRIS